MACTSNVETIILQIILEEEIMEVEPPAAGEPQSSNTDNTTTTENVVQIQNNKQKQMAINKGGEQKVYEIQEIYEVDIDSDTDPLVESDDELGDDEQQIKLEPRDEKDQAEPNKKRVKKRGSSRPLFRQKLLYRRQTKDSASSSTSEAPEKIEENTKPRKGVIKYKGTRKPVKKTKPEDEYDTGEGSSCAKKKKTKVPKGDVYNFSDDSNDE